MRENQKEAVGICGDKQPTALQICEMQLLLPASLDLLTYNTHSLSAPALPELAGPRAAVACDLTDAALVTVQERALPQRPRTETSQGSAPGLSGPEYLSKRGNALRSQVTIPCSRFHVAPGPLQANASQQGICETCKVGRGVAFQATPSFQLF